MNEWQDEQEKKVFHSKGKSKNPIDQQEKIIKGTGGGGGEKTFFLLIMVISAVEHAMFDLPYFHPAWEFASVEDLHQVLILIDLVLVIFEVYLEFEPHVIDCPLMVPSKIDPKNKANAKEKIIQENLQVVGWNYFSMIISIEVVLMKN